jgi:hypothetical protein
MPSQSLQRVPAAGGCTHAVQEVALMPLHSLQRVPMAGGCTHVVT